MSAHRHLTCLNKRNLLLSEFANRQVIFERVAMPNARDLSIFGKRRAGRICGLRPAPRSHLLAGGEPCRSGVSW